MVETPVASSMCRAGAGASITAVKGGRVIDTSMGLTPLEGLMMGTRCGDIDPAVVRPPGIQPSACACYETAAAAIDV